MTEQAVAKNVKLNKSTKAEVAQAILQTYVTSRAINEAVGNDLHMDSYSHQRNLVESELKEGEKALLEKDLKESVDAIGDLLVTLCEVIMIEDGDTALLKNAPKYLNEEEKTVEQLFSEARRYFNQENNIDMLGGVEDLCVAVNYDMIYALGQICSSNLSKFPLIKECEDPDAEADRIEDEGRYENVYFEEITLLGEQRYVFKSTYDKKMDEHFPKGKYLKAFTFFEPELG